MRRGFSRALCVLLMVFTMPSVRLWWLLGGGPWRFNTLEPKNESRGASRQHMAYEDLRGYCAV